MYVECKSGAIDGAEARIGWVTFSKTGKSIYYRGRSLVRANGPSANYMDESTREEYWVFGVKRRGSNVHPAEQGITVVVDEDALSAYRALRGVAA